MPFFFIWGGVPLKIHTRPEGSGMDIWEEPHVMFFKFGVEFPLISIPDLKGLVIEFGGHPRIFFINDF